ncbi:unnamed protein product [Symbiodinium sp. CCMP2592]|nr:unnamed protein product [Symbiodinium sp. CCMP2592]
MELSPVNCITAIHRIASLSGAAVLLGSGRSLLVQAAKAAVEADARGIANFVWATASTRPADFPAQGLLDAIGCRIGELGRQGTVNTLQPASRRLSSLASVRSRRQAGCPRQQLQAQEASTLRTCPTACGDWLKPCDSTSPRFLSWPKRHLKELLGSAPKTSPTWDRRRGCQRCFALRRWPRSLLKPSFHGFRHSTWPTEHGPRGLLVFCSSNIPPVALDLVSEFGPQDPTITAQALMRPLRWHADASFCYKRHAVKGGGSFRCPTPRDQRTSPGDTPRRNPWVLPCSVLLASRRQPVFRGSFHKSLQTASETSPLWRAWAAPPRLPAAIDDGVVVLLRLRCQRFNSGLCVVHSTPSNCA